MSKTFGPYSPIYQAGDFYFVSGQLGINPETKEAPSGVPEQTRQAMDNLRSVLATKNLTMDHLAQVSLYLVNIDGFPTVNEVYESYFDKDRPKPARECVEVSALPKIANVPLIIEISGIAHKIQS